MVTGSPKSIRGHKMLAEVVSGKCARPGNKCYRTNYSLRAWCVPAIDREQNASNYQENKSLELPTNWHIYLQQDGTNGVFLPFITLNS